MTSPSPISDVYKPVIHDYIRFPNQFWADVDKGNAAEFRVIPS